MKKIIILILLFISLTSFSQSIQSITDKISEKICDCMSNNMESSSEIKPEFNRCYDKVFNQIFNIVDSTEQKILIKSGAIEKVKNRIILTLNKNCEKIRNLNQSELSNSINKKSCPTNFTGKDVGDIQKWNGKIIAFNALVTQVHSAHEGKPYYQVKLEGGNKIWIASLIKSGFEKKDRILRILGYVSRVKNDEFAKKYNKNKYHILAFCVIDVKTKKMSMLPGSQTQIKEWINGKIPSSE